MLQCKPCGRAGLGGLERGTWRGSSAASEGGARVRRAFTEWSSEPTIAATAFEVGAFAAASSKIGARGSTRQGSALCAAS